MFLRRVGLLRELGPQREDGLRSPAADADREDPLDPFASQLFDLLARQLPAEPAGPGERDLEGLADDAQQRQKLPPAGQGSVRGSRLRLGRRDGPELRLIDGPHQDRDLLRVEGRRDALGDARRGPLERAGCADLLDDAAQQLAGVVALAEEAPVQAGEPRGPARVENEARDTERAVEPAALDEDPCERFVAVQEQIDEKEGEADRRERDEQAARGGVLEPPADDEADVEQAVAEDGVGERQRHRQHQNLQEQHPERAEVARKGRQTQEADHEVHRDGHEAHTQSEEHDTQAASLVPVLAAAVGPQQDGRHGQRVQDAEGDQDPEDGGPVQEGEGLHAQFGQVDSRASQQMTSGTRTSAGSHRSPQSHRERKSGRGKLTAHASELSHIVPTARAQPRIGQTARPNGRWPTA